MLMWKWNWPPDWSSIDWDCIILPESCLTPQEILLVIAFSLVVIAIVTVLERRANGKDS